MYQIGEFSYLTETTIKTIRYYDIITILTNKKESNSRPYKYYYRKVK